MNRDIGNVRIADNHTVRIGFQFQRLGLSRLDGDVSGMRGTAYQCGDAAGKGGLQ